MRTFAGRRLGSSRVLPLTVVALSAAMLVAAGQSGPSVAATAAPTFAKDVAPILYASCSSCHRPGGLGPFSLLTYEDVKENAAEVLDAIATGYMPPWHAEAPHGTFSNDRRLSDAEKKVIAEWGNAGIPLGDTKDLPPAPKFSDSWTAGTPDAIVSMPKEFHVPAKGTVEYQYFQVPTNFTEDKWIQAIEILPGAREAVHHVLVYAAAPEQAAAPAQQTAAARPAPLFIRNPDHAIPDSPARGTVENPPPNRMGALVGTTAPGTNVLQFAEGTALRIRAGTVLTFQMHYTAKGHAMTDRTSVGFVFAKSPPKEEMRAIDFHNGGFTIPAGAKDYMVPSELGFSSGVKVYGIFPHTHLRGVRWEYRLEKPDGTSEVILDIPNYDFNWQTYYMFAKPLDVPAGARITAKAWYNNSASNGSNPDPSIPVKWGEQTWEEMQYTGLLLSINPR